VLIEEKVAAEGVTVGFYELRLALESFFAVWAFATDRSMFLVAFVFEAIQ
jgi:hypothetical protein